MVGWLVGKLKWLLLVCAVGGPIVALSCWHDGNRRRDVMANGVETVATIESATRVKRRRGGTSYKLDLSWRDGGRVGHRAEGVTISRELADEIIVEDKLMTDSVSIKCMPTHDAKGEIDVQGAMQAMTRVVEDWIRENPGQWLWMHRRWRPSMLPKPKVRATT